MKKLNRKGFTLIELLAVIVILAVVMVVTIPSVLNTMANAKRSQALNALTTIEKYVNDQIDKCNVHDTTITGAVDTDIFETNTCTPLGTSGTPSAQTAMVSKAGYTSDIATVTGTMASGRYKITAATIKLGSKFEGFTPNDKATDGIDLTQSDR